MANKHTFVKFNFAIIIGCYFIDFYHSVNISCIFEIIDYCSD